MNTLADETRMQYFAELTQAQQADAVLRLADGGMSDHGISHATRLAIEQVRRILSARPQVAEDWMPPDADLCIAAIQLEQDIALQKWIDSDDRLPALVAENKRQSAEIAVLKQSRDGYMNRCGEQVRLIKSLQRKLERLEV